MRFRLKTDYLTFARDSIRGGLWYKPAWWDAVAKVPPVHFQPRIKKQEVPTIRFIEDKLMSDFKRQNAAIARFDVPAPDAADRRTVAQLFVERQVAAMRGDLSQKQAYSVAQQWMMENGKELFERLNVPDHVKEAIKKDPKDIIAGREAMQSVMRSQLAAVRKALKAKAADAGGSLLSLAPSSPEAAAAAAATAGVPSRRRKLSLPAYRSFRPAVEDARTSLRAQSRELVLPRSDALDAAEAGASAHARVADAGSSSREGAAASGVAAESKDVLSAGADAVARTVVGGSGEAAAAGKAGAAGSSSSVAAGGKKGGAQGASSSGTGGHKGAGSKGGKHQQ